MIPEYFRDGGRINQETLGGYIVPNYAKNGRPDPFAIAAAGIALGLDGSEIAEFLHRLNAPYPDGLSPASAYAIMVEAAYQIRMKRKGD